jgi:Matrixin
VSDSGLTAAYVLSGFTWTPGTTNWSYDATNAPAGLAGITTAISAAAGAWGATGATFHYTGGGASSNGTGACAGSRDGLNTIGWAAQSGSILAVTCSWYSGGAGTEFDMQIDPAWTWTTSGATQVDLQSVVTHELGHALGLGHSADASAVMYFAYTQGTIKRTPQADDVAGELSLYPAAGGSSPTPSPSPSPSATPSPTPSPTPTAHPSPSASPSPSPNPSPSPSPTATNTSTQQPTSSPTGSPTTPASGGTTSTATATATPTSAATATPTSSASATATPPVPGAPTLPLLPGANFLAWPGGNMAPSQALAGQIGAIKIVYSWDPSTNTWKHYSPNLPSFANNLTVLVQGQPYWFITSSAAQVPFTP